MCAARRAPQPHNPSPITPLVAYINVCAGSPASALHEGSSHALRLAVYAHEIVHVLGFNEASLRSSGIARDVPGADGLAEVTSPGVVVWARQHHGCPTLNAAYLVNWHWDPFFMLSAPATAGAGGDGGGGGWEGGEEELMLQLVSGRSAMTMATLFLLADLGTYDIAPVGDVVGRLEALGLWRSPVGRVVVGDHHLHGGATGCAIAVVRCGFYPLVAPAAACGATGVGVGQWVAAPYSAEVGLGPYDGGGGGRTGIAVPGGPHGTTTRPPQQHNMPPPPPSPHQRDAAAFAAVVAVAVTVAVAVVAAAAAWAGGGAQNTVSHI